MLPRCKYVRRMVTTAHDLDECQRAASVFRMFRMLQLQIQYTILKRYLGGLGRSHFSHSNAEWARKKLTSTPTFETHTNRVRCSLVVMLHQGHFINAKHYSLEPFFEYQISCNDRLLTLLSRTLLVFHYPSLINKLTVKIPAWKLHSRSDLLTVLKYPLLFRLLICHPNRRLFVLNVFFGVSL